MDAKPHFQPFLELTVATKEMSLRMETEDLQKLLHDYPLAELEKQSLNELIYQLKWLFFTQS
ncbi:hypothetical protein BKM71_15290 [Listeria monocytogenes]|nr:hypothetical protein BKM71_15290 [Listeria monocytogenes]